MGLEGTNLDFLSRGSRREQTLVPREEVQPLDEEATAALLAEGGHLPVPCWL